MKYISDLKEGDNLSDIYLCKFCQQAVTRNGKPYLNIILQDRTGTLDAKVWEPNSQGISDFDTLDYIEVVGEVSRYQGALQASLKRVRKAAENEYVTSDYLPVSKFDNEAMYKTVMDVIDTVKNEHLNKLLKKVFVEDEKLSKNFRRSSAAKSIHHGFVGGLMQHTLAVTRLCKFYTKAYPVLNHDLLITSALLHDIGKTSELSDFPQNDYTDDGQLLGHIVIGAQIIHDKARDIEGFPEKLLRELTHCILAHHGELEFGSPKKPALMEAMALNLADNTDAKLETFTEILENAKPENSEGWLGFNKLMASNLRKAGEWN
ncbi:3'-5' exoribonuclease YhaM family protein [Lachnospiraceae bacterium C1.1]|nr:HD domain-containing protein [Lachnospiraceae bacterium C1.1]